VLDDLDEEDTMFGLGPDELPAEEVLGMLVSGDNVMSDVLEPDELIVGRLLDGVEVKDFVVVRLAGSTTKLTEELDEKVHEGAKDDGLELIDEVNREDVLDESEAVAEELE
jgi:hypothetical protein